MKDAAIITSMHGGNGGTICVAKVNDKFHLGGWHTQPS